jgi:hypothetical protein
MADDRFRNAVEVAERFADGSATVEELGAAKRASDTALKKLNTETAAAALRKSVLSGLGASAYAIALRARRWKATAIADIGQDTQTSFLRDLVGNPYNRSTIEPAWRSWNDGTVARLAQAMYDARAFDGMPVLADALEEAGCRSPDIVEHCRGPGPHVRGCWVVDLLLGKE